MVWVGRWPSQLTFSRWLTGAGDNNQEGANGTGSRALSDSSIELLKDACGVDYLDAEPPPLSELIQACGMRRRLPGRLLCLNGLPAHGSAQRSPDAPGC